MAMGRIVAKKISHSMLMSQLEKECGLAGPFVFTWLIPHADRDGRLPAHTGILKGMIFPLIESVTRETIEDVLRVLRGTSTVRFYFVDGSEYIELTGFTKHQPGLRKYREAGSSIPPPVENDADSGSLPDDCRQTAGSPSEDCRSTDGTNRIELKLTQSNLTKENRNKAGTILEPVPELERDEDWDETISVLKQYWPKTLEKGPSFASELFKLKTGVHVPTELRKAAVWHSEAPSSKRRKNHRRFLKNWIVRADDFQKKNKQNQRFTSPTNRGYHPGSSEFDDGEVEL